MTNSFWLSSYRLSWRLSSSRTFTGCCGVCTTHPPSPATVSGVWDGQVVTRRTPQRMQPRLASKWYIWSHFRRRVRQRNDQLHVLWPFVHEQEGANEGAFFFWQWNRVPVRPQGKQWCLRHGEISQRRGYSASAPHHLPRYLQKSRRKWRHSILAGSAGKPVRWSCDRYPTSRRAFGQARTAFRGLELRGFPFFHRNAWHNLFKFTSRSALAPG